MSIWTRIGLALLVGVVVFMVLVPTSGAGNQCYSVVTFAVPCEGAIAVTAGAVSSAVTALALWAVSRRRAGG